MKQTKYFILFFISLIYFGFCVSGVFAVGQGSLRLQPMPSGVRPYVPGNINKSETNSANNNNNNDDSLSSQISQGELNTSQLDPNTSYVDTVDHRLFVADTDNNRVFVFDLNSDNVLVDSVPDNVLGQPDFTATDAGAGQSGLNGPNGIAYDPATERLFVADTNNNRIMVFNVSQINNGENAVNVLGQPDFTATGSNTTQSGLNNPFSLVYDPIHQVLFVTDVGNNRIMVFNVSPIANGEDAINVLGQPDFTTSSPGAAKSKLNEPFGIAYDSGSDNIFVADIKNNRVMVFGVTSISNGEDATNTISQDENSIMSQAIIDRMQSNPQNNSSFSGNKNGFLNPIFIWSAFLLIAIISVSVFFVLKLKKANKK